MKVIFVRPAYDEVSQKMSAWAEEVKLTVDHEDDLEGPLASVENLRRSLQTRPSALLVAFYGHGKPDSLITMDAGGTECPLIHITGPGVVPQELGSRNLYAVACSSGAELGPALAAAACSFVGYENKFAFPPDFEREFGDVVNRGLISWATEEKTSTVVGEQLTENWRTLSDELSFGEGHRKNLWVAAFAALWNSDKVRAY